MKQKLLLIFRSKERKISFGKIQFKLFDDKKSHKKLFFCDYDKK
jgi:hypothetical protein